MQHLSTAFLIFALVIAVTADGARAQFYNYEEKNDQLAQEAKNRAVTIIDGPTYVTSSPSPKPANTNHTQPDRRPPSKPPNPTPENQGKPKYVELPRLYIGQIQNLSPIRNSYTKMKIQHPSNSVYKYHKVIPLAPHRNTLYPKQQQIVFAASTSKPSFAAKGPKFSLPVETINGIRADFVRPPHFANSTTTSTTTTATTTTRLLRTKRIWPKRILEKLKVSNTTGNYTSSNKNNTDSDLSSSASHHKIYIVEKNEATTSSYPSTRPPYRRVTRVPKKKPTTPAPANFTHIEPNDWVPIVPSHFQVKKVRKPKQSSISRRSDRSDVYLLNSNDTPAQSHKRMMFLHSFGLFPVSSTQSPTAAAVAARKNVIYLGKTKQLKPHVYSGYRGKPVVHTRQISGDYQTDESIPPSFITRIKHHHHHHHHRYVKTVEKPVRVEVPKPVPVPVPMPVPVQVEKKVPYPVHVKVPHPVPVKVIEKEYVPKPYPVYQQVPVVKHVQVKVPHPVPVHVEKQVPYPVHIEVPVPKPYPVAVPVEKRVPVPYPVRILVPQPIPVETKVPVPVREPIEVVRHVPVRVPVPQPYPVRVPQPVPVPYEKKVPYPVEVEKKVPLPVPFRVMVPEKVEVEKKVPVYIPRPYPVEKKVPVPVKVPYPVKVPIKVPIGIPFLVHPAPNNQEQGSDVAVGHNGSTNSQHYSHYAYSVNGNTVTSTPQYSVHAQATDNPHQTVTFHGNTVSLSPHNMISVYGKPGLNGFQSRADVGDETTTHFDTTTSTEQALSTPEEFLTGILSTDSIDTTNNEVTATTTIDSR